jgi:hypothetical protein
VRTYLVLYSVIDHFFPTLAPSTFHSCISTLVLGRPPPVLYPSPPIITTLQSHGGSSSQGGRNYGKVPMPQDAWLAGVCRLVGKPLFCLDEATEKEPCGRRFQPRRAVSLRFYYLYSISSSSVVTDSLCSPAFSAFTSSTTNQEACR